MIERKFIETIEVDDWLVETDNRWENIEYIGKTIEYIEWGLTTENGLILIGADTHLVFDENYNEVFMKDLKIGQKIITKFGLDIVKNVEKTDNKSNMFDLQLPNNSNKRFFTGDILSHNSMWMQNIAVNVANQGGNVIYVTLELGKQKCMKRTGCMRLKIPSHDYNDKAKDTIFMKNRINAVKSQYTGMFSTTPGKIFIKKYSTSDCSISDVDNYIKSVEERYKIKINMVCVDYLNLMSVEKGLDIKNNLFLKGKHLAEGLRYLADKYNCAFITATQTSKDVWDANDIELKNMPESKAIAETADTVWAIIRNPEMMRNNVYRLKLLKMRDGEIEADQVRFKFHKDYLTMDNDEYC